MKRTVLVLSLFAASMASAQVAEELVPQKTNNLQDDFVNYLNTQPQTFIMNGSEVSTINYATIKIGTSFYDFDYDGDEDLIVSNGHVINYPRSGRLLQMPLLLMNEINKPSNYRKFVRKRFDNHGYMDTQHSGRGLAMGDLDGDGVDDLIVVDGVRAELEILAGGDDLFSSVLRFPVFEKKLFRGGGRGIEPRRVMIEDFDGDGLQDVAILVHDRLIIYPQDSNEGAD